MNHVVCVHYSLIDLLFYLCYIVVQTIKFTFILLVRSLSITTQLKRMPLPFQMNIDKDFFGKWYDFG